MLCQHEVQELRAFHAAYAEPQPAPDPEVSLSRLRDRLPPQRSAAAGPFVWQSLRQWLRGRTSNLWVGWVVAAQFAAIAILGVLVMATNEQPLAYRTLGASGPAEHARGNLVVVFDPSVTEEDLRRILRSTGARIVDGPTSTHAYVLQVEPARQADTLAALRAETRVTLAERLEGGR